MDTESSERPGLSGAYLKNDTGLCSAVNIEQHGELMSALRQS